MKYIDNFKRKEKKASENISDILLYKPKSRKKRKEISEFIKGERWE